MIYSVAVQTVKIVVMTSSVLPTMDAMLKMNWVMTWKDDKNSIPSDIPYM